MLFVSPHFRHWKSVSGSCDRNDRVLAAGVSGSLDPAATADKARCKGMGKTFPRFSARRSIPAHAVELKKYAGGIEPRTSTCDNEHTAASLGQSDKLGVENPPCDCPFGSKHSTSVCPFSPCRDEDITFAGNASKEAAEGVCLVTQDSRYIFPYDHAGRQAVFGPDIVDGVGEDDVSQRQLAARVVEAAPQPRDRVALAWCPTDKHIWSHDLAVANLRGKQRHVAVVGDARKPVCKHARRGFVRLGEPC